MTNPHNQEPADEASMEHWLWLIRTHNFVGFDESGEIYMFEPKAFGGPRAMSAPGEPVELASDRSRPPNHPWRTWQRRP